MAAVTRRGASPSPAAAAAPAAPPNLRPPLLWQPRAATIPGIIMLLIAVLLCEVSVMTYVSTPTERERSFEASQYTVEYRDCWVIEHMAEIIEDGMLFLRHMDVTSEHITPSDVNQPQIKDLYTISLWVAAVDLPSQKVYTFLETKVKKTRMLANPNKTLQW